MPGESTPLRWTGDGRLVNGVGHLGHDEATQARCREFDPLPGHYSRMSF